jgi:hypothetical protein
MGCGGVSAFGVRRPSFFLNQKITIGNFFLERIRNDEVIPDREDANEYSIYSEAARQSCPGDPKAPWCHPKGPVPDLREGLRFVIDPEKGKATCQMGKVLTVLHTLGIKIVLLPPANPEVQAPTRAKEVR